ncbi:hypothetical protein [Staphylococcus equorum]|uniref:hypothetical protein n=1 Tax=Staphylococcus equorum TaxID=246432 RepID=UPI000DFBEE1C|nr:hypothetical protein [Staphylococcus equorum]QQT22745.1 hypothetical protein I6J06_12330 [Staphylococcus equorum]RTX76000.1 hypothetical protein CD125_12770 [Staphylococcus equorum subsp. equorum]SUM23517.1 membrane protein [Staphylococcus equorum]
MGEIVEAIWGLLKLIVFIPYILIVFGTMLYVYFCIFIWIRRPLKRICDQYYGGDSDDIPNIGGPYIVFMAALGISFVIIMILALLFGTIFGNFGVFLLFIYGVYLIAIKLKKSCKT